jgi:hypothetical protein
LCPEAEAPIAAGVISTDLAAAPLNVNWLVPSVVPPFNCTLKEFATEFAAPPLVDEPAYFVESGKYG